MAVEFEKRGELFRDSFNYLRKAQESFPNLTENHFGNLNGQMDILPKASGHKIPMLVTGNSRQSIEWIAQQADGWMYYPRNLYMQEHNIRQWRSAIPKTSTLDKPFMQPLYVDLQEDDDFLPQPIHLGLRIGANHLIDFFQHLKSIGVNHVGINLRFNSSNMAKTLEQIAKKVLPHFHLNSKNQ